MNKYRASVITAVGKLQHYSDFIERYYINLQQQTIFEELEVIIIYMEWHPLFDKMKESSNIRFILDDEGKGMYNAWNIGIRNATTDYVTNWNIDDLRYSTNIERKVALLESDNSVGLAYSYYLVSGDINETFDNFNTSNPRYIQAYPDEAHKYVYQACLCGPDPLWRRKIHEDIGYFDLNYPAIGDWEMWIRMASRGYTFKLIPEVLCLFYDNPNSVSNRYSENIEKVEKGLLFSTYEGFKNPVTTNWHWIAVGMGKKLSILIPSLNRRKHYLDRLLAVLNPQTTQEVEILISTDDGEKTIGKKRNELLHKATGDYVAFVDDDDLVAPYYVEEILKAIKDQEPDVIGIHLHHIEDGILKGLTYHSLKYTHWWDEPNSDRPELKNYYRNPNHLNPIKREYALSTMFPEINHGEDRAYSYNILKFLRTEVYIEKPIYEYLVRTQKEC